MDHVTFQIGGGGGGDPNTPSICQPPTSHRRSTRTDHYVCVKYFHFQRRRRRWRRSSYIRRTQHATAHIIYAIRTFPKMSRKFGNARETLLKPRAHAAIQIKAWHAKANTHKQPRVAYTTVQIIIYARVFYAGAHLHIYSYYNTSNIQDS